MSWLLIPCFGSLISVSILVVLGFAVYGATRNTVDLLRDRADLDAEVVSALYDQATARIDEKTAHRVGVNVAAAIFWLKARQGWRDRDHGKSPPDTPPSVEEVASLARKLLEKAGEKRATDRAVDADCEGFT